MNERTLTEVVYSASLSLYTPNGTPIQLNASAANGGAVTFLAEENWGNKNIILINPSLNINQFMVNEVTDAYYITPFNPTNGNRFVQSNVSTNRTDLLFHEIGHVIYAGKAQHKVIDYNNYIRVILGFPERRYDETHNSRIYGNRLF